jgi:hypothetical protein
MGFRHAGNDSACSTGVRRSARSIQILAWWTRNFIASFS